MLTGPHSSLLNKLYYYLSRMLDDGLDMPSWISPEADCLRKPEGAVGASGFTNNTGDGTDHDDYNIRDRDAFRWETAYSRPRPLGWRNRLRSFATEDVPQAVKAWLGFDLVHRNNACA